MGGMIKQKVLEKDRTGGEMLYQFQSEKHYIDEVNQLTSPKHLPKIAKALIEALKKTGPDDWEEPIAVLIDGKTPDKIPDFAEKLLFWMTHLGPDVKEKLISVFEQAEKHDEPVGILFGLCYDPSVGGMQVSFPNVFQTGLIPVVITAGREYLTVVTGTGSDAVRLCEPAVNT